MNIRSEKENLLPFSIEAEAFSPYLSPLLAINNSQDLQGQSQFQEFYLDQQEEIEPEQEPGSSQQLNEEDKVLEILVENKSSPEADFLESASRTEIFQKSGKPSGKKDSAKINSIINFLIDNDDLPESQIKQMGKPFYQGSQTLQFIFVSMISKFKKLKKTKQEMTKFCMRKAFKFISDGQNNNRKKSNSSRESAEDKFVNFQMPFRKNSSQKTMNALFLKQIFSNPLFACEYQKFLGKLKHNSVDFRSIITKDNQSKIKYLSDLIEEHINTNNIQVNLNPMQKIQTIKRLPWTRSILTKTEQLAFSLAKSFNQKIQS